MTEQSPKRIDRNFAPDARYAANTHNGARWYDDRTGQEHWSRHVGVDTLMEAGASIDDPSDVQIVSRIAIGPYQPDSGQWIVEVTRTRLTVREDDEGGVAFVTTSSAVLGEVFDDRDGAVEYAEGTVDSFADAERRDAVAWREDRREEQDVDGASDGTVQQAITATEVGK